MAKQDFSSEKSTCLKDLPSDAAIHFIGVSGVAMGQLAAALSEAGYQVSGSDQAFYEPMGSFLKNYPIKLFESYKADNLNQEIDLVVIGNAISYENEEVAAVEKFGLKYTSLPQLISDYVIADKLSIVVTGTHGKTTSTGLIAQALKRMNLDPSYLIGGVVPGLNLSLKSGMGDISVVEGDEYDSAFFAKVPKFSFYRPNICLINAIEFDHADIYDSLDSINNEFKKLVKSLSEKDILIINIDFENLANLIQETKSEIKAKIITYGENEAADYQITAIDNINQLQLIKVQPKQGEYFQICTSLLGSYNAKNLLASTIALNQANIGLEKILSVLPSCQAPKRRQEVFHTSDQAIFIEDFAHHPTSVRQTLESFRALYPENELIAVFEPASNSSRTKVFQNEFKEALSLADKVVILEPQKKSSEAETFSCQEVCEQLGNQAVYFKTADEIVEYLKEKLSEQSTVLTMSNGSFDGLKAKLVENFS